MAKKNDDKFQTEDYLKADQHEKDMSGLTKRIEALEDKLGQNEKFANTFCEAVTTQSKIKDAITDHIVKQIGGNPTVQGAITKQINKADRDWGFALFKKLGFAGWTLLVALASGAAVWVFKR